MPDVSIIIPLYNRADLIEACLRSIQGADPERFEVIVVDDGSSDASPEIVRRLQPELASSLSIRLIEQENSGPGPARNLGAVEARGRWLAFLDSDDLWRPWTARTLLAVLDDTDAGQLVFLAEQRFSDEKGWLFEPPGDTKMLHYPSIWVARRSNTTVGFGTGNAVIATEMFRSLGGFTGQVRHGEDMDLFFRLPPTAPVTCVVSPFLVGVRFGHSSLTADRTAMVKALQFLIARDRAGRYSGNKSDRNRVLADMTYFNMREDLASGHAYRAYQLWLKALPLLVRDGRPRFWARLPLTPLLALFRPEKYPFRWRADASEGRIR